MQTGIIWVRERGDHASVRTRYMNNNASIINKCCVIQYFQNGRLNHEVQTHTLSNRFLTEMTTLSFDFHRKWSPFTNLTEELRYLFDNLSLYTPLTALFQNLNL